MPWLVVALLTGLMALYVAAEFSAVAIQKSELAVLAKAGHRRAAGLLEILDSGVELDRYIAACQIGITLSSLVAGAYAQATIAVELVPFIERVFEVDRSTALSAAFTGVLLVLTALQVVIGELVPKSLALEFTARVALITYLPMRWSMSLYRSFVWLLNGSALLMLKPFGITPGGHQHVHSSEEIELMLAESRQGGMLSPEEHRRLERGLQMRGRVVREMMTPRDRIQAVDASLTPDALLARILDTRYSRLPVYRGSLDNIVGAIGTKEIVAAFARDTTLPSLTTFVRPIPFVSPTLPAPQLVRFLQERRSSKAVVIDEAGVVQGLISIEDVLAELFGDIGEEPERRTLPRPAVLRVARRKEGG